MYVPQSKCLLRVNYLGRGPFFFQIEDNTHSRTARLADGVLDALPRFAAAATAVSATGV